jgi:hypothetical protein
MGICYKVRVKRKNDPEMTCIAGSALMRLNNRYIDVVDDFCKTFNYDPEQFVLDAPLGAIYLLLRFKKDSEIYVSVFGMLKKTFDSNHSVTRKVVESFIGIKPTEPKAPPTKKDDGVPKIIADNPRSSSVSKDNSYLLSVLKPPQIAILQEIMKKENCDNEYAAMIKALIWAKERMKKK